MTKLESLAAEAVLAQQKAMGIDESDEYGAFKAGDLVKVAGENARFTIKSFRLDALGNCRWVTVIGGGSWGQSQTREYRSFLIERLIPLSGTRGPKDDLNGAGED